MAVSKWLRKRKKGERYYEWSLANPCEGLEVNRRNANFFVGRKQHNFTMFDSDNIAIGGEDGTDFKPVSIMEKVKKANPRRSTRTNRYKERINGRE